MLTDPEAGWSGISMIGLYDGKLLPRVIKLLDTLQQIYVLTPWHGRGVAERLMRWALANARADGAPEIYLTVFDHNARAKRFYSRHGFIEVGHCTFTLGDIVDDDRVWRKML
jgi:GNAT superfamily N-acetyltransferase